MLAVTQPCGMFCVPPLTPIHLRPGKWAAQPLILILNSQTSLLEKSPPCLKSKTKLKTQTLSWMLVFPKPAPSQTFPSLTCFLHWVTVCHFIPASRLHWIWWWAHVYAVTGKCLHPELDEIRTTAQQNCVSWTSVVQKATNDSPSLKDPGIWASGTIHFIFLVSAK